MKKLSALILVCMISAGLFACSTTSRLKSHDSGDVGYQITEIRIQNANSWLVQSSQNRDTAILIDAGLSSNVERLVEQIKEAGTNPSELDALIVTHGHFDHVGGARYFQQTYGTPIVAGLGDRDFIEYGQEDQLCPTIPFARLIAGKAPPTEDWTLAADHWVSTRLDLNDISGLEGEIIVLEGHTPGSLIVNLGASVFVGDLVRGRAFGNGPARHIFMCDIDDNNRDLSDLLKTLAPEAEMIYPGHLGPFHRNKLEKYLNRQTGAEK